MTGGESRGAVNVAEAMAVIRAGTASFRLHEHVHDAARLAPHLAQLSPNSASIPGGAIDVAARLTRTCHDTRRRCRKPRAPNAPANAAASPRSARRLAQCLDFQLIAGFAAPGVSVLMITVRRSTFRHLLHRTSCCRYRCLFTAPRYSRLGKQNCVEFTNQPTLILDISVEYNKRQTHVHTTRTFICFWKHNGSLSLLCQFVSLLSGTRHFLEPRFSQGSVATCARCGGISNNHLIANF